MTRLRFALSALAMFLAGCSQPASSTDGKLAVVCTTGMIADAARIVGGDRVQVEELMGPGVDPHTYKASAGDLKRLRQAKLVLYNGLHLEGKMADVFAEMGKGPIPTVAVAGGIDHAKLRSAEGFEGSHDPHVWFDVSLWSEAVAVAGDALIRVDPAHTAEYQNRTTAYRKELALLHDEIRTTLAQLPPERRVLVTAHDAFYYFGRAYGLEVHGLQGISTASEPSTRDVQRLAKLIGERKVPAIFGETSVPDRNIEAVRAAVKQQYGHDVTFVGDKLFSDALGSPGTPGGTYLGMVRQNARTIKEALAP